MSEKAFPLADAELTIALLDLIQQGKISSLTSYPTTNFNILRNLLSSLSL
jgi:hypothetical protein